MEIVQPTSSFVESLPNILGPIGTAGIVLVFTIFMLLQREDLRNRFIRLAGDGRLSVMTQAMDEAGDRVSHYLFLQSMVNASYGLIIGFQSLPDAFAERRAVRSDRRAFCDSCRTLGRRLARCFR